MLVPDDFALVQWAMENFPDRAWRPASWAFASRGDAFRIQELGDSPDPQPAGGQVVNLTDNRGKQGNVL
jgi:hypothetical protein